MITPSFLQHNDTIGIIATARKISYKELNPAIDKFGEWGLTVVLGEHIFHEHHQYSGMDNERTDDLQKMLNDPSIKAIIVARGGYGTVRLIDSINFSAFVKKPKWIVGYSDVSALHSHIHQNFGIETLHATMPINFPLDGKTNGNLETLRKSLFGEKLSYSILSHPLNRYGQTEGVITGGNLSLLYSLNGTVSDIDTNGKILFIEDLDEYLYHIDRMMMNLKRSGKLALLKGLIVGGMTEMKDNDIPFGKDAYKVIAETVSEYAYPVCFGFPAGHTNDNQAIILGRNITLIINQNSSKILFDVR